MCPYTPGVSAQTSTPPSGRQTFYGKMQCWSPFLANIAVYGQYNVCTAPYRLYKLGFSALAQYRPVQDYFNIT